MQLSYEPHKTTPEEVRTEAIQTAAMALRLAMSLDLYEYRRGEQHKQSGAGDRFIGRDIREIEALAAKGLREDTAVQGDMLLPANVKVSGPEGGLPPKGRARP